VESNWRLNIAKEGWVGGEWLLLARDRTIDEPVRYWGKNAEVMGGLGVWLIQLLEAVPLTWSGFWYPDLTMTEVWKLGFCEDD